MVERSQKEVWRLAPWLMIALLLGNFILMAWHAKTETNQRMLRVWALAAASFIQSPVTSLSSGVTEFFQSVVNLRSAATENDNLKQRIHELEVEVHSQRDLALENERLKTLLNLKNESKYPILPARVIGRDPSNWFNDFIINRGSLEGVKLNMPIVTDGGLVGRVTAVSPLSAQVTLVTDERAAAGAVVGEIGTSNALGVIKGTNDRELLEMQYVPGSIEVKAGDMVFTTGQEGIYPPGLRLGEIVEVRSGSATVSHIIYIKPSARINSMQEVAVLLYEPPPRQKLEQSIPNALKDEKGRSRE